MRAAGPALPANFPTNFPTNVPVPVETLGGENRDHPNSETNVAVGVTRT